MKRLLLRRVANFMHGIVVMVKSFCILSFRFGQWRSAKERMAIDSAGINIPWYTYPAIEYLQSFDFKDCDVFEFGCGNSSLFWASKARSVISVEDNKEWFNIVSQRKNENQLLLHRDNESLYVKSLSQQGRMFDVIVIDGKWREGCVIEAVNHLQEGGMIVLDNSDRIIEKRCNKLLRKRGFFQIDFSGFGPINGYCWTTSIFIKAPTLLQQNFADPNPIGGLRN